jgi:hypothetical protein
VNVFRARLAWIASAWLAGQLSLLAAAPVSLFAHAPQAADAVTCTCIHTGNAQCPMHHPAKPKPGCECRNSTDPDAANIVSLLGPIAVMPHAIADLSEPPITPSTIYPINRFEDAIVRPTSPPPRA